MASNAVQKVTNRLKAKLEEDRSPVEKDQATVPIADAMRAYWERDMLSFAIPAWKVQSTALAVGRPYRLPVGAVGNWPRVRLAGSR